MELLLDLLQLTAALAAAGAARYARNTLRYAKGPQRLTLELVAGNVRTLTDSVDGLVGRVGLLERVVGLRVADSTVAAPGAALPAEPAAKAAATSGMNDRPPRKRRDGDG